MPPGQLLTKQPIVRSIASPTRAESTQPAENSNIVIIGMRYDCFIMTFELIVTIVLYIIS